uniref:Uncharacterized protein n=2 Tax=Clytia hemisphaerica TaxID=252671 RepID=A0A7M5VF56_9CNID
MVFGQILTHDVGRMKFGDCPVNPFIFNCEAKEFKHSCFAMYFEEGKPECTFFAKGKALCQEKRPTERQQVNEYTSFVDMSNIYGNNDVVAKRLRRNDGSGELITIGDNMLPFLPNKPLCVSRPQCSDAGDVDVDQNTALWSIHVVWVREHNRVAKELKQCHPDWDDDKVYQEARKIVIAEYQHITYNEYVPKLADIGRYSGYKPYVEPSTINAFNSAAFRFAHSTVPNFFHRLNANYDKAYPSLTTQEIFGDLREIRSNGIEPLCFGLIGNQSTPANSEFAFAMARKILLPPSFKGPSSHLDLSAFNIHRGRDTGMQTYGEWRKYCGLRPIKNFRQLRRYMPTKVAKRFAKVYDHPNDIDLFAAGVSENHVPGFAVGPTFQCLIKEQFMNLRDGDRYFYLKRGVFTPPQRRQLKKVTMARILCDNLKGMVSINKYAFIETKLKRTLCEDIPKLDLRYF